MFRILLSVIIYIIIISNSLCQNKTFTVTGNVINSIDSEPLENCNIFVNLLKKGTSTNNFGDFSIDLPIGKHELKFSYIGFFSDIKIITITKSDLDLQISLKPKILKSDEVQITAKKEPSSIVIQKIENKDIQKMPTIYSDVLRSVQILSGVSTNSELTSGYNVRGGSFDENLIYLNGYEIYRPFLLRVGVEESQTTINPNMVEKLTFYNGAFPASYGDRMSSALEVDYSSKHDEKLKGSFYASVLNLGINLKNRISDFNWQLGVRYANPSAFLSSLKTKGDYKPSFSDIQFFGDYKLSNNSNIELLGIYSDNRFDVSPTNWSGNFGFLGRGDYRGVSIASDGERVYSYLNSLLGIRYKNNFSDKSQLKLSISRYWVNEKENYDLSSNIYYFPDAFNPTENLEFLKSRYEKGNNSVTLNSYRFKTELNTHYNAHNISLGAEYRFSDINNYNYENFYEVGDSLLNEKPINNRFSNSYNLNSFSLYIDDYILLAENLEANVGVRYLKYDYSKEKLISPRAYLTYKFSPFNSFKFSWGYYYQPPFINELKSTQIKNLKSQRAIHYVLGWENQVNEKLKFNAEIYYKDLYNIIPFYFDEFRMVYVDENNREGYAVGLDLKYEGEIVDGMKSWVGYSYLDSRERKIGEKNKYQRRLLDQTHTLQIFLQDKMRKHPNWQSHLRFLLGSGYLYYQRKLITDVETSESYIDVDFDNPQEYFFYFRVDMGLSASFNLGNNYKITGIAEILNVFNQLNAGAYEWVHIFKEIHAPLKIPHVLSKRFLNLKVELNF
jgi:TonB dependent receptor-like, beta-barrel/CarboxypepD_reg-like domain/TonB-dependent Receptor Plug Domain